MPGTGEHVAILLRDDLASGAASLRAQMSERARKRVRFLTGWREVEKLAAPDLFVVSHLHALGDSLEKRWARKTHVGTKRFLIFPGDSPIQAIPERIAGLAIRSEKRLHMAHLGGGETESKYLRRLAEAASAEDLCGSIVDAWCEDDELVILSPAYERLRVPFEFLPKLGRLDQSEIRQFEIDELGDFLYWGNHDVHIGWSQFEQLVNPEARLRAEQRSDEFNARYGQAIREFRESCALTQRDIRGLSERTVRRIEQGSTRATTNAISKIAAAHALSPSQYMSEIANRLADQR